MIKNFLRNLRDLVIEQYWRFTVGIQFLTLINFVLLVISASDKLKAFFNIDYTMQLVFFGVLLAFIGIWVIGFVMDRVIKFPQQKARIAGSRNPYWTETHAKLDGIIERLDRLEKKRR
ncbi:hypothetical protein KAW38_03175 [Candidatus Micrarchaeota archaeon]|nr:hypothetical protein [Candidatus Micrarchaeota archaeon]